MLDLALLSFLVLFVYAQEIPDYYKPYAPIFTDKQVYTWTDKVHITIVAPSWNAHRYGIDTIGDQEGHFIKISTGENSLEPYKLVETDPNSGIFTGEIILTGFLHDTDDDGQIDTNPQTSGNGPTDGMLQVDRDDGFTISFEFADGVVLTHSASISWNVGKIIFDKSIYLIGETAKIKVIEPDMNLRPEIIDNVEIKVSSNSDKAGIVLDAKETDEDSGIFEATVSFTQTNSFGNQIHAIPGDIIYAKYEDATLPSPNSISDSLDIKTEIKLESDVHSLQRISTSEIFFADTLGKSKLPTLDQPVQIAATIQNNQDYSQSFVYVVQISDQNEIVKSVSWITGQLNPHQLFELSVSWTPTDMGDYSIEAYVWNSLQDPIPLSPMLTQSFVVEK